MLSGVLDFPYKALVKGDGVGEVDQRDRLDSRILPGGELAGVDLSLEQRGEDLPFKGAREFRASNTPQDLPVYRFPCSRQVLGWHGDVGTQIVLKHQLQICKRNSPRI